MQARAHLGLSWLMGRRAGLCERVDRRFVGPAGLTPDVDVLSSPIAYLAGNFCIDAAYEVYVTIRHSV